MKVLIAGESWITQSTHIKGVDSFTLSSYVEGVGPLRDALEATGHTVAHLPAHLVPDSFPATTAELDAHDVLILSDIGANSLLLPRSVAEDSQTHPNRFEVIADWVRGGGALLMVGGYFSFNGLDGRARFGGTPVEGVLPVTCVPGDDRREAPEGQHAVVTTPGHPALGGAGSDWPTLLGWNRTEARADAEVLASIGGGDVLVAVREVADGRSAVFTSDCAPHWATPAFCEQWDGYARLFDGLVTWLARG